MQKHVSGGLSRPEKADIKGGDMPGNARLAALQMYHAADRSPEALPGDVGLLVGMTEGQHTLATGAPSMPVPWLD